jgi:hypothetical protein
LALRRDLICVVTDFIHETHIARDGSSLEWSFAVTRIRTLASNEVTDFSSDLTSSGTVPSAEIGTTRLAMLDALSAVARGVRSNSNSSTPSKLSRQTACKASVDA